MASKKEHKRKQKAKKRKPEVEAGEGGAVLPAYELNSVNLLSAIGAVGRPAEGDQASEAEAEEHREPPPAAAAEPEAVREPEPAVTPEMEEQAALRASEYAGDGGEPDLDAVSEEEEKAAREAAELARLEDERRREAEAEEARRREAEAEETRRREAEEEERRRREAAAAERAKLMAEAAEKARLMALEVERARRENEEAERRRREEVEKAAEAEAVERARLMAEEAEKARKMAERVEQARREAEAGEEREMEPDIRREPETVPAAPPPLEVDNPYWEKPPEIFEMLSGAPHSVSSSPYGESPYGDAGESLPVTMTEGVANSRETGFAIPDYDEGDTPEEDRTMPVPPEKRMYIVMVTPEVAPCAKVGGLGDVILGLGRELMKRGHGVEVICPMYSGMRYDLISDLHEEYAELWCPHYGEWRAEKVFQGKVEGGLQVNFITGGPYTELPNIYCYEDYLKRFTYFSRQALEFMYKTNRRPDVIHCHDWATGLVPAILWDVYQKLGWDNSRVVYTIHNNECQGLCGFGDKLLSMVGLDVRNYLKPDKMQDDTHRNCINMMKSGIVFSNFVTTVSPTYAGELKSAVGGRGLQLTVAKNSAKVGGVLNGIDYDSWNPQTDGKLAARYSAGDDFFEKYKNKTALREWLGLHDAWKPIVSVVTRLTQQKGLDLIKAAIFQTLEMEGQFVLLGSAPDPKVNADFLRLQNDLKDNHDVNLYIGYHEDLSRLIYAGSDMFLIPSLYEPCGLTQMISLRYGTVPVVRETGGLLDTVFDLENSGRGLNNANGFTFRDPTPESLHYGLGRAIRLWYENPEAFNRLARNGMRYDYSWRFPTEHYENIYNYIRA